jgi:hypothetical protein
MTDWLSRYFSLDDLWSAIGYFVFVGISRLGSNPMPFASVSMLASGMVAILWVVNRDLRARNAERNPNIRVAFWALVAVISALGLIT